jgi:hypothetical protein
MAGNTARIASSRRVILSERGPKRFLPGSPTTGLRRWGGVGGGEPKDLLIVCLKFVKVRVTRDSTIDCFVTRARLQPGHNAAVKESGLEPLLGNLQEFGLKFPIAGHSGSSGI